MSKERLSKLQRVILETLYRNLPKIISEQEGEGWLPHAGLIFFAGEKLGKVQMTIFGRDVSESFQSTFSQSLRNLADKGMVELWKGWRRVTAVRITEKGEAVLSLTCKLRIREEGRAAFEQANKKVEAWIEGSGTGLTGEGVIKESENE